VAYAQTDPFAGEKDESRGDPGDAGCCMVCNDGPLRETNKSGLCTKCFNNFSSTRRHWRQRHGLELTVASWIAAGGHPSGLDTGPRSAFWKHSGKWIGLDGKWISLDRKFPRTVPA
jgi:hypothetical protein